MRVPGPGTLVKLIPGAVIRKSEPEYPIFGSSMGSYHVYLGNDAWLLTGNHIVINAATSDYYLDRIVGGWACFVEEED